MPSQTGSTSSTIEVQAHEIIGFQVVYHEHSRFFVLYLRKNEDLVDEGSARCETWWDLAWMKEYPIDGVKDH